MKVNGSGNQKIINEDYANMISVVINGNEITMTGNTIHLTDSTSILNINCVNTFTSCENMFNGLSNITEIDLTNFDGSNVQKMNNMFSNCID